MWTLERVKKTWKIRSCLFSENDFFINVRLCLLQRCIRVWIIQPIQFRERWLLVTAQSCVRANQRFPDIRFSNNPNRLLLETVIARCRKRRLHHFYTIMFGLLFLSLTQHNSFMIALRMLLSVSIVKRRRYFKTHHAYFRC